MDLLVLGSERGIRVLGVKFLKKLEIVWGSVILHEQIASLGLECDIWQYFTVFPDICSVDVISDTETSECKFDIAV
ncbi:hypothetical protein DEJ55_11380 [Bacillus pumilus]|nr:hypothetical protein DEJ55_11380 [Bacillus pumilus]